MKELLIFLCLAVNSLGICANEDTQDKVENYINEYRIYSLAKCIQENYKKMGVDFQQLPLKDMLDKYIERKAGNFYKPKHARGDMASINLVAYECVEFYESAELKAFLKEQIQIRLKELEY